MIFSMIVAVSENDVIGLQGDMPWQKLPADLKYFKEKTTGHWCILGRKTYDALGNKVLPGRKFIIVTRDENFHSADSIVVHSLGEAMRRHELQNEHEIFILGGGEIFTQLMEITNRIYLTRIHASFDGDAFFPQVSEEWKEISHSKHKKDEKNPYDYDFLIYERKKT